MRMKDQGSLRWKAGDRLYQVLIVPVASLDMQVVEELDDTNRGHAGFGSTGE